MSDAFASVSPPSRHGLLHSSPRTKPGVRFSRTGLPQIAFAIGLLQPGYLAQLRGHHSPVSVGTGDVSLCQSQSASSLPLVRGFPALRVLWTSPTSNDAFAFLRNNPFGPHTQPACCQAKAALDLSVPQCFRFRACRAVNPAAVSGHHRL